MTPDVTLVGIGSRVCGDDAIGLVLVEQLAAAHALRSELWEDRDALDVTSALLEGGRRPVLLVDCADMGLAPGSCRGFDAADVRLAQHAATVSTHGFGLADALALARELGHEAPIRLFGVQPFDVRPGRTTLSEAMAARVPELLEALWRTVAPPTGAARVSVSLVLRGVVQGVGMRPTLARLARAAGLGGSVQNRSGDVFLTLEGEGSSVETFLAELPRRLPPQAQLEALIRLATKPCAASSPGFTILDSPTSAKRSGQGTQTRALVITPDLAPCPACHAELLDPDDRRHRYAFTTCTDCGPRYTVVEATPYDRARTTLIGFPLCSECAREYADPADRRYHAQSTACPACGPQLSALTAAGTPIAGDPLDLARACLTDGGMVALKGVGGFQLVASARSRSAIAALRRHKARPDQPVALMAASVDTVRRACRLDPETQRLLTDPSAPIVLLDRLADADGLPLELLAPDTSTLGVMLPASPLHVLLAAGPLDWLVVTSGNAPGAPICLDDAEALDALSFVDLVLTHDRPIAWRADDSIVAPSGQVLRRARGFAPAAVRLHQPLSRTVLALGAGLKNTVALGTARTPIQNAPVALHTWLGTARPSGALRRAQGTPRPRNQRVFALASDREHPLGRSALEPGADGSVRVLDRCPGHVALSPHIGDLASPGAIDACTDLARALPRLLQADVDVVAVDLHPDLASTRIGEALARDLGVPLVRVQHHHAHAAACLAENHVDEGLALVFDGVGLGSDGTLWGGELLHVEPGSFTRLGTLAPAPLPGGDAAVRHPSRQLVGRLAATQQALDWRGVDPQAAAIWARQCERGVNAPVTHAAGRLFDSVAAALGLAPRTITYEGQAAIRLETAAHGWAGDVPALSLPVSVASDGLLVIDWAPVFGALRAGQAIPAGAWALAFHRALAHAAAELVQRAGHAELPVALSGGVFQNRLLTQLVCDALAAQGRRVVQHRVVPPNDGGIALGQAVIAGRSAGQSRRCKTCV